MNQSTQKAGPIYSTLGSDPILGEIVELFVTEMPLRVEVIQEQLAAAAWEDLRRTAHQLKGSAGSYGFGSITSAAAELENAIREEMPEMKIREAAEALISLCERASAGGCE